MIETRLAEWRRLLRASTTQGRTMLQRILRGRLTFTPRLHVVTGEPDGYDFAGETRFDKLFTGIAVERPKGEDVASLGSEGSAPKTRLTATMGACWKRRPGRPRPCDVLPEREVTAYSERMGDTLPASGWGMPWKECHVMDERLRFVARLLEGEKMAPLCAEFGISRKTGYNIFDR